MTYRYKIMNTAHPGCDAVKDILCDYYMSTPTNPGDVSSSIQPITDLALIPLPSEQSFWPDNSEDRMPSYHQSDRVFINDMNNVYRQNLTLKSEDRQINQILNEMKDIRLNKNINALGSFIKSSPDYQQSSLFTFPHLENRNNRERFKVTLNPNTEGRSAASDLLKPTKTSAVIFNDVSDHLEDGLSSTNNRKPNERVRRAKTRIKKGEFSVMDDLELSSSDTDIDHRHQISIVTRAIPQTKLAYNNRMPLPSYFSEGVNIGANFPTTPKKIAGKESASETETDMERKSALVLSNDNFYERGTTPDCARSSRNLSKSPHLKAAAFITMNVKKLEATRKAVNKMMKSMKFLLFNIDSVSGDWSSKSYSKFEREDSSSVSDESCNDSMIHRSPEQITVNTDTLNKKSYSKLANRTETFGVNSEIRQKVGVAISQDEYLMPQPKIKLKKNRNKRRKHKNGKENQIDNDKNRGTMMDSINDTDKNNEKDNGSESISDLMHSRSETCSTSVVEYQMQFENSIPKIVCSIPFTLIDNLPKVIFRNNKRKDIIYGSNRGSRKKKRRIRRSEHKI